MTILFNKSASPLNKPFEDYIQAHYDRGGIFVDMGCGDNKIHPSFIGVDPHAESNSINVQAYMWDTPFEDNTVDLITCFMALEHVSKFQVPPTLQEFERILKPGGVLALIVPNLKYVLEEWISNPNNGWEMDMIFGTQLHEGEYHKTGFSVEIIEHYFTVVPSLKILNIYDINAYTQWSYGILARKLKN